MITEDQSEHSGNCSCYRCSIPTELPGEEKVQYHVGCEEYCIDTEREVRPINCVECIQKLTLIAVQQSLANVSTRKI